MQTRRSTVLGKRGHQEGSSTPAPSNAKVEQLQTPDSSPNPKRARTIIIEGDDSNKENIPPFANGLASDDASPRSQRALRRSSTVEVVITPRRARPLPRRAASNSELAPTTPVAEPSQATISTPPPTPPAALLPIHVQVRAILRATCNSAQTSIAGREVERATIEAFLASLSDVSAMDEDNILTGMFISGSPGTGKTALVNDVLRNLETEARIISINCMALKSVDALWERMVEELSDLPKRKHATKKVKGRDAVALILNDLKTKCILILDELDHITPNAAILTSIFSLSESYPCLIRLIGIANTHTLTSNALTTSSNVRTIHFAPYTPAQLQKILQSRLASISDDLDVQDRLKKFLPQPTLMLLTKKVAAMTGDVRSLFEVLRGAIDFAIAPLGKGKDSDSDENPLDAQIPAVTPQHVLAAQKAYAPSSAPHAGSSSTSTGSSETLTKIQNLGLQARLALLVVLLASNRLEAGLSLSQSTLASPRKPSASPMKRSHSMPNPSTPSKGKGVGIETGSLYSYYTTALSRTEMGLFEAVSKSEFGDVMGILEGVGLVSLSSSLMGSSSASGSPSKGRRGFSRTASFGGGMGKNGAGAVGEVRLVEGVWADEVLRGLGISATTGDGSADAKVEEVQGIWQREQTRLSREVKAAAKAANSNPDVFSGAFEDD